MKERLRELAEQAGRGQERWNTTAQFESFLEKYAELIVQGCISTLNDMHMWQSVNNQNYPNSWHDAVDQGIDAIKSHFGVEE